MFFAIFIFTFTGILAVVGLGRVERRFDRWRPKTEENA
jgi:ABC-type nitrate/sulfonate/bicarbonate transport system permease component